MTYAEIVFPIPLDRSFHYRIPDGLNGQLKPGVRVQVDFGRRSATGYCVGFTDALPAGVSNAQVKDIIKVIDLEPLLSARLLELCRWIADYYFCSLGQAIEAALPAGVRKIPTGKSRAAKVVDPFLSDEVTAINPHIPNSAQADALKTILPALESNASQVFLLHGITGSGKTEVYLQAITRAMELGKQSIVLVPEIALTPQTIRRFRERFPTDKIAVLHSYLTEKERTLHWKRIRSGAAQIVIGARSAIFAPTINLGLIVIDEEHEPTYKQQNTPMYHARDVAVRRAQIEQAVVILGSATPALESFHLTTTGKYHRLILPERVENRPLPPVDIVDMSLEVNPKNPMPILSRKLEVAIRNTIDDNEQAILFLNRRGFVTMVTCPRCRNIIRCKRCEVALTYHKQTAAGHQDKLHCHHCGKETDLPDKCPACGYPKLKNTGTGTEKVVEHIQKLFASRTKGIPPSPFGEAHHCGAVGGAHLEQKAGTDNEAPTVGRMDSDSMRNSQSYHQALQELATGETDIMVGTQMIAKGLDLPNVTLVGIISGDTVLYIKDFRSAERTFQLITQVAGRSGRGPKGGRVIVQTFNPEHYSIKAAARHDYETFARQELLYRYELNYPPFSHLMRILVEGRNQDIVQEFAGKIVTDIAERLGDKLEILGPAPAPLSRLKGRYRWHIVLKAKDFGLIKSAVTGVKQILPHQHTKGVSISFENDPLSLL